MRRTITISLLALLVFSCSPDPITGPASEPELESNHWTTVDGRIVFYSAEYVVTGGYVYIFGSQPIAGAGTMAVDVNQAQGTENMEFGLKYRDPDIWGQQFDFYIKKDGTYHIGWVDDSGVNGVNAEYHETGWIASTAILQGLDVENTLSVAYDTTAGEFTFSINGTQVFQQAFDYIRDGQLGLVCDTGTDAGPAAPYRFEYRVTSPFISPIF